MSDTYEVVCSSEDRETWLAERQNGLGGSDASTILGLNPWRTPLELWAEKTGRVENNGESEASYWGTVLEEHVLRRYALKSGRPAKKHAKLLRSVARPWQLATLDGEQITMQSDAPGVVEIKCTGLTDKWEEGPPPYVVAQVQHQLAVTGWSWATVAALFNARELKWWDVGRDEGMIQLLNEEGERFWNACLLNKEPTATASDSEILKKLYPAPTAGIITLGDEWIERIEAFEKLKAEMKSLRAKLDYAENTLKQAIGEHEGCVLSNGWNYSLKVTKRAAYTVEASEFRSLRRLKDKRG
jgi:putative phage-type endonuclease